MKILMTILEFIFGMRKVYIKKYGEVVGYFYLENRHKNYKFVGE
jgi:hypothetical protein